MCLIDVKEISTVVLREKGCPTGVKECSTVLSREKECLIGVKEGSTYGVIKRENVSYWCYRRNIGGI